MCKKKMFNPPAPLMAFWIRRHATCTQLTLSLLRQIFSIRRFCAPTLLSKSVISMSPSSIFCSVAASSFAWSFSPLRLPIFFLYSLWTVVSARQKFCFSLFGGVSPHHICTQTGFFKLTTLVSFGFLFSNGNQAMHVDYSLNVSFGIVQH